MKLTKKEIMLDNWLIVGKGTDWVELVQVDEIFDNSVSLKGREFTTYITSLDPIEINEELLLKNGFKKSLLIEGKESFDDWIEFTKCVENHYLSIRHCSNSIERDWFLHIDNENHSTIGGMDIEYVHQLQNACTIAGFTIDLIIEL